MLSILTPCVQCLQEMVQSAFKRYDLLDDGVQFHKGYFRDSLPKLRSELLSQKRKLALLRMDGDM